jgi:hypothetical protein
VAPLPSIAGEHVLFVRNLVPVLTSEQTAFTWFPRVGRDLEWPSDPMMRGELAIVILFVAAIALVSGFIVVALMFPELLPWYTGPSQRSSPPASSFWEESVA